MQVITLRIFPYKLLQSFNSNKSADIQKPFKNGTFNAFTTMSERNDPVNVTLQWYGKLILNRCSPADQARYLCKQCRPWWDGSLWAVSSGSKLFANPFWFLTDISTFCKNGYVQIQWWKSPFHQLRVEKVKWETLLPLGNKCFPLANNCMYSNEHKTMPKKLTWNTFSSRLSKTLGSVYISSFLHLGGWGPGSSVLLVCSRVSIVSIISFTTSIFWLGSSRGGGWKKEQYCLWTESGHITKTCLYSFDPLKLHFYTVKLGFTWVYIINFLISAQKHRLWVLVRTASPRRF